MSLTRGQIINLYTTGREAGISKDDVKSEFCALYGVTTSKDLLPHQYREYLLHLQTLCADHRLAPASGFPEGKPALGYFHNAASLREYVSHAGEFGRLWPGQSAEASDGELLVRVMDLCRNYRGRWARLSQKQLDWIIDRVNSYPLWAFRIAADCMLRQHPDRNERYFVGIMEHQVNDAARAATLAQSRSKSQPAPPALTLI